MLHRKTANFVFYLVKTSSGGNICERDIDLKSYCRSDDFKNNSFQLKIKAFACFDEPRVSQTEFKA